MLDLFYKIHSQAILRMLFKNSSPLSGPSSNLYFSFSIFDAKVDAGHFAEQNELWVLQSRASSLVEGFKNP